MFATIIVGLALLQAKPEYPTDLKRALANRDALATGVVRVCEYYENPPPDVPCERMYSVTFGVDTRIVEGFPNEAWPDMVPCRVLIEKDGTGYALAKSGPTAPCKLSAGGTAEDVRPLGFIGDPERIIAGMDWIKSRLLDGALRRIEAGRKDGLIFYMIVDTAKDHAVVENGYEKGGVVYVKKVSTLGRFDGRWFPQQVAVYKEGVRVMTEVVTSAEFNRPQHKKHLTLSDLGLRDGQAIYDSSVKRFSFWSEKENRVIPNAEFAAGLRSGRYKYTPSMGDDQFTRFARSFAKTHGLTLTQATAALSIAKDVRDRNKAATQPADINDVIDRELKPRLLGLLTKPQDERRGVAGEKGK